jgi:chromate transporter
VLQPQRCSIAPGQGWLAILSETPLLQTFIQKRRWMSETAFLELFSLSSCLPGPTSTQVSFALGAVKKGIPGGLLGGVLFQYPGLIMMSVAGVGAANFLNTQRWWAHTAVDGAPPRPPPPVGAAASTLMLSRGSFSMTDR